MADWGKVIKITEMSKLTPEGEVVKFYRHSVRTTGGVSISVDINEEDLIDTKAEPILKARANAVDKIKHL